MKKIFKVEYAPQRLNEKFINAIWFNHNELIEADSPLGAAELLDIYLREHSIDNNIEYEKFFFRVTDENEEIYFCQSDDFE